MIGYLRGNVILEEKDYVIIDVNGVGYKVFVPDSGSLPDGETELYVSTNVSENAISLFGFQSLADRQVFEILCEAHGIGPKSAMSFLSVMRGGEIASAIVSENDTLLSSVPGISSKKAQKLILELKDKFKDISIDISVTPSESPFRADAVDALVALGYGRSAAQKAVDEICSAGDIKDVSKIITKALARLSKKV